MKHHSADSVRQMWELRDLIVIRHRNSYREIVGCHPHEGSENALPTHYTKNDDGETVQWICDQR
jgi:hypothetical protein